MPNNVIREISTFAEFMVCPGSLNNLDDTRKESHLGINDFKNYKFRHLSDAYRGDSQDSELLDRIRLSFERLLNESGKKPLLLLSDGKDSMSLALALSSSGISCQTLTFLRRDDHSLRAYIQSVADDLGHESHFVNVDEIHTVLDEDFFLGACSSMKTPVLDQGFLFFLFGCKVFFNKMNFEPSKYVIIDGLGNDEHFGYLPSNKQLNAYRLATLGFWKLLPRKRFPFLRWYFRSPAEAHGDLSALAAFFPFGGSYDLNTYFSKVPKSSKPISFIDFRSFARGSFHDHQCMMGKTIATARMLGCDVLFPWADSKLADYCFNLATSSKFDFHKLENKLLLRELLSNEIGWSQKKRGVDLFFDLNVKKFKVNLLFSIVPEKIVNVIDSSVLLPLSVKKRAYLELLNLYGFCRSHGLNDDQVEKILYGRI